MFFTSNTVYYINLCATIFLLIYNNLFIVGYEIDEEIKLDFDYNICDLNVTKCT